jgi:hypothetical protein
MRKAKVSEEDFGHQSVVARAGSGKCTPLPVLAWPISADELWTEERARERLLGAFGQLTIADIIDAAGGDGLV